MNRKLKYPKRFCFFAGIALAAAVAVLTLKGKLFSIPEILAEEMKKTEKTAAPQSFSVYKLSGWLWSYNIGWVELTKVYADAETGGLAGYGWSYNIGWVDFAPAGPYPEEPQNSAKIDFAAASQPAINGWLRVVNGLREDSGGWDGWIKLVNVKIKGTQANGWLPKAEAANVSAKKQLSGFAWGSAAVGWLDFSGADIEFVGDITVPEQIDDIKDVFGPKFVPSGGGGGGAAGVGEKAVGEEGGAAAGEAEKETEAPEEDRGIIDDILKLFQPRKEVAPR